jgi:perosamine synthetase
MADWIPVNQPCLTGNEEAYLIDCVRSGWISSEGPYVKRFEAAMAAKAGRLFGVAVCNGSAALDAAVQALDLAKDDEIIVPTFTIISCVAAIIRGGCRPVLVDCDQKTWNMDASAIEAKITSRTRAIMVVHIYGLPVDMDPILSIAQRYGLYIIEDAAEMHGQTYRGKPCGSFGHLSTFSFYPNKHVTCGEGGMLVTDSEQLDNRSRLIRNLFFQSARRYVHEELGYNLRMTSLQAAVGLAQLECLDAAVQKKRWMGALYTELLHDVPGLQLPVAHMEYADNIFWVYGIVLTDAFPLDNMEMLERLKQLGVDARTFFWPMHEQPVFKKMKLFQGETYPVAEKIARRGFYVPSGLALSEEQIRTVCGAIREIIKKVG